jgi:hypothetical protein
MKKEYLKPDLSLVMFTDVIVTSGTPGPDEGEGTDPFA